MDVNATATQEASTVEDTSSKQPIWTYQSNRVDVSIWKHPRKAGARYTIGISRSYYDRQEGRWVRTNFYDGKDLADVERCSKKAKAYLNDKPDAVEEE
jgi:hypothetical protein